MLRKIRSNLVGRIASRHIAGRELADALNVCRWAHAKGFKTILSPWSGPNDDRRSMYGKYIEAIDALQDRRTVSYLSMKLDAIGYDRGIFMDLVEYGSSRGVRVHVDSLGPDTADTALDFVEQARSLQYQVGYTLASRWRRSVADAERIAELGVPARIVKGQWNDPSPSPPDCRKNYVSIAERLAKGPGKIGIATHDIPLATEVLTMLSHQGADYELEQFFSLPLNGVRISRQLNCEYRIYVAYGYPGLPYNVRFTLTRPGIAAWVFADFALKLRKPWSQN